MLRINPAPEFQLDAKLTVPGAAEPAPLRLTVRHKGRAAIRAWLDGAGQHGSDTEFLGEVVVGWSGVVDDKGREVPYSPEALARVLDGYPAAAGELFRQYLDALQEGRRGN